MGFNSGFTGAVEVVGEGSKSYILKKGMPGRKIQLFVTRLVAFLDFVEDVGDNISIIRINSAIRQTGYSRPGEN